MNRLQLVQPTRADKDTIIDYKQEFIDSGDSMDGTAGLKNATSFEAWFQVLLDNSCDETVREGLVPSTTYLVVTRGNHRLIGMIDIRHRLNDHLLKVGGHIGYSVRKSERCKGYATEMLALALKECKKNGIEKVLLTCHQNNIASARTIIHNGGVLENEPLDVRGETQRYWITL
jgi:predicted acetyltransferase